MNRSHSMACSPNRSRLDDARLYVIFRLDPRARFSDGVPVSAADVLFTFDLLKQKGRPQQRDAFGRVKRGRKRSIL